jgi:hypothetical protein
MKSQPLKPDVVVHTCNPYTQEEKGRGSRVQGQPGLQEEDPVHQNKKQKQPQQNKNLQPF